MEIALVQFVLGLAEKHPVAASIFMVVGVLRALFKPLVSFARAYVIATPTPNDDLSLDKVEASKIYKSIAWFFDYAMSIKLPNYDK